MSIFCGKLSDVIGIVGSQKLDFSLLVFFSCSTLVKQNGKPRIL